MDHYISPKGDGRDFMPDWENNYLSWSFGLGFVGVVFQYVSGILFLVEARIIQRKEVLTSLFIVYFYSLMFIVYFYYRSPEKNSTQWNRGSEEDYEDDITQNMISRLLCSQCS